MECASLLESLSRHSPDHSILDSVRQSLRDKIEPRSTFKLLDNVRLNDGTCLVLTTLEDGSNESSMILMTTLSERIEAFESSTVLLQHSDADLTCGIFATTSAGRFCVTGDVDGSVILFSCEKPNNVLAKLDCSDCKKRSVLKIIQDLHHSDNNVICFWVAYSDSIEQIACNITPDRVIQFVKTLSLKFDKNDFGTFHSFEVITLH